MSAPNDEAEQVDHVQRLRPWRSVKVAEPRGADQRTDQGCRHDDRLLEGGDVPFVLDERRGHGDYREVKAVEVPPADSRVTRRWKRRICEVSTSSKPVVVNLWRSL